jgi:hypothetical protein
MAGIKPYAEGLLNIMPTELIIYTDTLVDEAYPEDLELTERSDSAAAIKLGMVIGWGFAKMCLSSENLKSFEARLADDIMQTYGTLLVEMAEPVSETEAPLTLLDLLEAANYQAPITLLGAFPEELTTPYKHRSAAKFNDYYNRLYRAGLEFVCGNALEELLLEGVVKSQKTDKKTLRKIANKVTEIEQRYQ